MKNNSNQKTAEINFFFEDNSKNAWINLSDFQTFDALKMHLKEIGLEGSTITKYEKTLFGRGQNELDIVEAINDILEEEEVDIFFEKLYEKRNNQEDSDALIANIALYNLSCDEIESGRNVLTLQGVYQDIFSFLIDNLSLSFANTCFNLTEYFDLRSFRDDMFYSDESQYRFVEELNSKGESRYFIFD